MVWEKEERRWGRFFETNLSYGEFDTFGTKDETELQLSMVDPNESRFRPVHKDGIALTPFACNENDYVSFQ